jgi:putative ABC transport system permease protein
MNLSNLFQYIGFRHVKLKPSRSILTTLGVAFGIALYVAIAIINHSIRDSMKESIESVAGKAQLVVTAGVAGFDESRLEDIRTTPGVKTAVPLVEARAFFDGSSESYDGLQIMGVDLLQDTSVRSYKATDQRIIDDPLVFLNQPDSIILTKHLAEQRGLKLDSKFKLSTANGAKEFTVRGLLEPEGAAKAFGGALALMDIDGVRVTFGRENKLDRVDIVPEKNFTLAQVKKNLEDKLGGGLTVERPESQSEATEKVLATYQLILTFFSTLALMVGLFLVMNSISVAIAERRREIGILRALGATRVSMVILFITEVFGIGLIGSILGCILGMGLAHLLSQQIATSISSQFQSQITVSKLDLSFAEALFTIVLGTIASVLAAAVPALKAATIHPLESMKKHAETYSKADENRSRIQIFAGLAMIIFNTIVNVNGLGKYWIGIDLASKGASVLGAALFGPFVVFVLLKWFRGLTSKLNRPVLRLAQENLMRSRRRTSANVMALMVGLFLVVMISTVRSSFHDTLTNWLDQIFVADIMVGSNGRFITADVQPLKEEVEEELNHVEGIRPVQAGRGSATRIVPIQYVGNRLTIKAIDQYSDYFEYRNFAIPAGDRKTTAMTLFANDDPHVLTTGAFLTTFHKKVGETIDLDTPSGKIAFQITGVIIDYASPKGVFYMSRKVYKKYWKDTLVTGFFLDLLPGYTFEKVRENINQGLGRKWNLVTISNQDFKNEMQEAIDRSFAYTKAIEYIALLVGLLGLLNTLLISVMERTREIGMLRAVGSTRTQISRMILLEALLQGFFGAIVAIILGSYAGAIFVKYGLTSQLGWVIEYHFPKESLLSTLFTGVLVAGIAGYWPARRAANLQITEALEYE